MKNVAFASLVLALGAASSGCNPTAPERASSHSTAAASASAKPMASVAASAAPTAMPAHPPPKPDDLPAPADYQAAPADAEKTASGLASKILTAGKGGEHPKADDMVKVHYTGWQSSDGWMFDSSVKRGEPAAFKLNQVIKGWTEGVQLMAPGEKRRFWIPATLAYGEVARRPGSPAGTLVFDIELLEIVQPPSVPTDVKAPPANAKKTASGISYRSLSKGTGKDHPTASSTVKVHYSGWTPDGKMFDSSVMRGQPTQFSLGQVIKGWTEGVQLMTVGEKMRFWIPGKLAYGDTAVAGRPSGMLVFDIELLEFK